MKGKKNLGTRGLKITSTMNLESGPQFAEVWCMNDGWVGEWVGRWLGAREGVIIKWPLNGQFHDAVTNVLTSRPAVSGVV